MCPPGCRPGGILSAPGLCRGWSPGLTVPSFHTKQSVTHLPVQPRPPGGQHVLAEPGRAPTAPFPGGGVQDLQVRAAHDPVHAEVGRLSGLANLGAAHACQERGGGGSISAPGGPRLPRAGPTGEAPASVQDGTAVCHRSHLSPLAGHRFPPA